MSHSSSSRRPSARPAANDGLRRRSRSRALSVRLALASLGTALAVGTVCVVGLRSLTNVAELTREAVTRQLAVLENSHAFSSLLYQKGFVAEYLLTGDRAWLERLERTRPLFEAWLTRMVSDSPGHAVLAKIEDEYAAYDRARRRSIALFESGDLAAAKATLADNYERIGRLLEYFRELGRIERLQAEATLASSEASLRRLARLLVGTAVAGAMASLLVGFLWARRITRRIYELNVQVESATERTRIEIAPRGDDLDELAPRIGVLIEKLEAMDAELAEHRRRLVQSEKLSAIGELAAKLAHEVLNPLTGMKAAVQLLARQSIVRAGNPEHAQDRAPEPGADVTDTAAALNREISRVEALVRRLVNFARPLAPRFAVSTVATLIDEAIDAARPALSQAGAQITKTIEDDLPPLEVDPLLIVQAVTNLVVNAAQAAGGSASPAASPSATFAPKVHISAARVVRLGREEVVIAVSDNGPGLSEQQQKHLFHPFFTTKADGHGLGLAVSQNIVLEHGGQIEARNQSVADAARAGAGAATGAAFEIFLPVLR